MKKGILRQQPATEQHPGAEGGEANKTGKPRRARNLPQLKGTHDWRKRGRSRCGRDDFWWQRVGWRKQEWWWWLGWWWFLSCYTIGGFCLATHVCLVVATACVCGRCWCVMWCTISKISYQTNHLCFHQTPSVELVARTQMISKRCDVKVRFKMCDFIGHLRRSDASPANREFIRTLEMKSPIFVTVHRIDSLSKLKKCNLSATPISRSTMHLNLK